MQHGLLARAIHLEHRSVAGSAAGLGGTVEVARLIHDQTCLGKYPVRPREAVQYSLRSGRIHLEHGSVVVGAAVKRGAVEAALRSPGPNLHTDRPHPSPR